MTGGATSTQANGFFGACLKYSGYDAIVLQGQAKKLSYLYINDDTVEIRDAAHLAGKDTWEMQQALETEHGLSGHRMSVYGIGPAGENLVRFAAIHGDYGHVASKNGCGAVMGKKKLKAVCIVRGTKSLRAHDARGLVQAADDIAHDLKTDPSTSTLYNYGTLPGVLNLSKLGVLPIKNYTTNLTGMDMSEWEPTKLREGFDHRGHQCSACGMRHCHIQVIRNGPHKGERVDEPEYEGWSGAGWTIGLTDKDAITWLNTRIDRACVDVNEFGWVCGWVMECMEKGYLTEEQVGFRLTFGDAEGAYRLLRMISHREGFGDVLAEGVKRASEKVGGEAAKCAVYTKKGASPRGHDHRGRWDEMLDTCTSSNGTMESANPTFPDRGGAAGAHPAVRRRAGGTAHGRHPRAAALRGLARRVLVHVPDPHREPGPGALGGDGLDLPARGCSCASAGGLRPSCARSTCAAASGRRSSTRRSATAPSPSTAPPRTTTSWRNGSGCSTCGTRRSDTTARRAGPSPRRSRNSDSTRSARSCGRGRAQGGGVEHGVPDP